MLFAEEIPARATVTPEASGSDNCQTWDVNSSALLMRFALALSSEKTRQSPGPTLFGHGIECEIHSDRLATRFSPFDCEPVALALTTRETGCSCSPRYPTPTATDWKGSTGKGSRKGTLAERLATLCEADGKTVYPHPEFVEALMGFPVGWTDLEDSETLSLPMSPNGSEDV